MRRTLGIAAAISSIHLVCAAAAAAQVVDADASADACPRNALKIYFASGDVKRIAPG